MVRRVERRQRTLKRSVPLRSRAVRPDRLSVRLRQVIARRASAAVALGGGQEWVA